MTNPFGRNSQDRKKAMQKRLAPFKQAVNQANFELSELRSLGQKRGLPKAIEDSVVAVRARSNAIRDVQGLPQLSQEELTKRFPVPKTKKGKK